MIRWMLSRMESEPGVVFHEQELMEGFPSEFAQAKEERLVRGVPIGKSYSYRLPRPRLLVQREDGKFEAIDDEDPEEDPIVLELSDLRRWSLDLQRVARRYQEAHELTGSPQSLCCV